MSDVKEYKFQPTDDSGRPIGGVQVIKYTTSEELADKLKEQNVLLIRKLRQETKKIRLGIIENDELPEDTATYDSFVEFSPRELTEEERYEISRDLLDPGKAAAAAGKLLEAQLGGSPSDFAKKLNSIQETNLALTAKLEVNAFISETPEYYGCQENFETLTSYMVRYNLYPSKENFKLAFKKLNDQGLLVQGSAPPVVVPEPVSDPVIIPDEPQIRVPSGLTRDNSSDVGIVPTVSSEITYIVNGKTLTGLEAINAMPGEEYGRRLRTDKNFPKLVEKVEAEARKNKGK